MSQNTSTSASFVERIQTVFQEQVSSEYKRRSGIGSESDQQEWVNERYAQLNKAMNEMVTLPGTKPEFPEGHCASKSEIEQGLSLLVQDNDTFCQTMVELIPRYYDALTAEYRLKKHTREGAGAGAVHLEGTHTDQRQPEADVDVKRAREMAELEAALRLSNAPRPSQPHRADELLSPSQVSKEIGLLMCEALRSIGGANLAARTEHADGNADAGREYHSTPMIATMMKHLNLNMMEEQDAEEWKGEESVDKLENFLSQYTQIVTNIGQAKGRHVKAIIKAVNILKHFVVSGESVNNNGGSVYGARAAQAEHMVDRLVYTNESEGESVTAAELTKSKAEYKTDELNVQRLNPEQADVDFEMYIALISRMKNHGVVGQYRAQAQVEQGLQSFVNFTLWLYLRTAPNMIGFIRNAVNFYHTLLKKHKLKNEDDLAVLVNKIEMHQKHGCQAPQWMQLTLCVWDFLRLQPNDVNGNNARKSYLSAVREAIYEGKPIRPVEWLRTATTCLWWDKGFTQEPLTDPTQLQLEKQMLSMQRQLKTLTDQAAAATVSAAASAASSAGPSDPEPFTLSSVPMHEHTCAECNVKYKNFIAKPPTNDPNWRWLCKDCRNKVKTNPTKAFFTASSGNQERHVFGTEEEYHRYRRAQEELKKATGHATAPFK